MAPTKTKVRRNNGSEYTKDFMAGFLDDFLRIHYSLPQLPNRTVYKFYSKEGVSFSVSQSAMALNATLLKYAKTCLGINPYADVHHLFWTDIETKLLRSLVNFLHTGVLMGNEVDNFRLCKILMEDFGFTENNIHLKKVHFDSEQYEELNAWGINSHFCEWCGIEAIPLSQIYTHLKNHFQQFLQNHREGATYICEMEECNIGFVSDKDATEHLQNHLLNLANKLKLKYQYHVNDNDPLEPLEECTLEISTEETSAVNVTSGYSRNGLQMVPVGGGAVEATQNGAVTENVQLVASSNGRNDGKESKKGRKKSKKRRKEKQNEEDGAFNEAGQKFKLNIKTNMPNNTSQPSTSRLDSEGNEYETTQTSQTPAEKRSFDDEDGSATPFKMPKIPKHCFQIDTGKQSSKFDTVVNSNERDQDELSQPEDIEYETAQTSQTQAEKKTIEEEDGSTTPRDEDETSQQEDYEYNETPQTSQTQAEKKTSEEEDGSTTQRDEDESSQPEELEYNESAKTSQPAAEKSSIEEENGSATPSKMPEPSSQIDTGERYSSMFDSVVNSNEKDVDYSSQLRIYPDISSDESDLDSDGEKRPKAKE